MNTADEKGSVIGLMRVGKFLPQPGPLTPSDLAQYIGLYARFYSEEAAAVSSDIAVQRGTAHRIFVTRMRRY